MKLEIIATTAFGLEAVVRREIENLGFKITEREDGRITYIANEHGLVRSLLWLRAADRVLLKMGEFDAPDFESLFQGMRGIAWEMLIPEDGDFTVNCVSAKSKLTSVPACQSVAEKGLISRLQETYGEQRFSKAGAKFDIKVRLLRGHAVITVDVCGTGLHKRGYRVGNIEAPIKETLAAAMVQLSFWKAGRLLVDPLCGSGTIPIEAALYARNIAPGMKRNFVSETWDFIPPEIWKTERAEACKGIDTDAQVRIFASDIDPKAVAAAKKNAREAGVADCITFRAQPFRALEAEEEGGIVICNPPYGERMGEKEDAEQIYREVGVFFKKNPSWSLYLLSTNKDFEKIAFQRPADRRRKLYNGRLETTFYQYYGAKPPKVE
jgi:putative N6-adenine-specific DNA methylase